MKAIVILVVGMTIFVSTLRAELRLKSGPERVSLLELYTSEGCSSCPPAEEWFNSWKDRPELWKYVIPVVFHVHYWDYLGWKDPYAREAFTERQRRTSLRWGSRTVYTPCVVLNGEEWRSWRSEKWEKTPELSGELDVLLQDDGLLGVRFAAQKTHRRLTVHAVYLAHDEVTDVQRGENRGRILKHHFVVVKHVSTTLEQRSSVWSASLDLGSAPLSADAIALWVEEEGIPLQAAGAPLDRL